MMIQSAEEFVSLRTSEDAALYSRAASDEAPEAVWIDVITRFPEMKAWVAHNKTVPLGILRILACDPSAEVRFTVAMKRKLDEDLFEMLAEDRDETVRHRIAVNKKAPARVLQRLSNDAAELVRNAARDALAQRSLSG